MKKNYKSYSPETTKKQAGDLVKKITKQDIVKIERLNFGEVNAVYFITTSDKEKYVLRISPNIREYNNFLIESWAFGKCRKLGIPVPLVIAVDTSKRDFLEAYMLTERMPGKSGNLIKLSPYDRKKVVKELGFYMSQIHKVKIKNFGRIINKNGKFVGKNKSLYENIENEVEDGWWVGDGLRKGLLPAGELEILKKLIKKKKEIFSLKEGSLVHGDLSASFKNINISGNRISGIFDMENAKSYDPVYDIAWFDFWRGGSSLLDFLIEGYEDKNIFDVNFEAKKNIYELILAYSLISYYSKRDFKNGLDYSKEKINLLKKKIFN